jgi:hypothetical protein
MQETVTAVQVLQVAQAATQLVATAAPEMT